MASRSMTGKHAEGEFPDHPGYVRGKVLTVGYHIQPYETLTEEEKLQSSPLVVCQPGGCKVTLCAHTELGGSFPAYIVNMLSTSAPVKILEAIRNILTK